ncbi:FAD-dependent oxidoreductase [Tropicimonas sp. TH_r6]|uniref:FAD-dependent oxidoreductase n=1 Tax=Tropicimonas sp. TH_r6 TaxID=3082085 RepID=UPI002954A5D3|nr:FAD-dependent oxidoreductase [Tropicimonas sp. TH_r6]MDV7141504.1 FAD-dependent oxidoreductase [Tropicimonas sp. TH_r6]
MAGRVIIVGGGYVGSELARALDNFADVTLVEQRESFCHVPVLIRAVVDPDYVEKAMFRYDSLLNRGRVVRGRVASVDGGGVTLEDGTRLEAEAIVVATGSRHSAAFKPEGSSVESVRTANLALGKAVAAARHVAVVGGGALGVELAGEIRAARPATQVTLISPGPLLEGYEARLGKALARKLKLLGAELVQGRVLDLSSSQEAFAGPLRLEDGREIDADLVIPAVGSTPDTSLLESLDGFHTGPNGRAACDSWMRPSDLPNVFAAGDAADNGDPMTIVGASRQVLWLTRAVRTVLSGKDLDRSPVYHPWVRPPLLVPLGPQIGNSILPVVGMFGNATTRMVKGRDLFLPKYRKMFRIT